MTSTATKVQYAAIAAISGTSLALLDGRATKIIFDLRSASSKHLIRNKETPRENCFDEKVVGFGFAATPGIQWGKWFSQKYWNEEASYALSKAGALTLLEASNELHDMYLLAIESVINKDEVLSAMGIPVELWSGIRESWKNEQSDVIGRFDLLWRGEKEPPKLLEYNGDTPTVLVESAVAQSKWQQEVKPGMTQCNLIEMQLMRSWPDISRLTFTSVVGDYQKMQYVDDYETTRYLMYTARQQGLNTNFVPFTSLIVHNGKLIVENSDSSNKNMKESGFLHKNIWKLYPWEWMVQESVGEVIDDPSLSWLEPKWKLLAANKGMLAVLWHLFPEHPLLLPAYFIVPETEFEKSRWVSKPSFGREGTGILKSKSSETFSAFRMRALEHLEEWYTATMLPLGPPIFQEFYDSGKWAGRHVTIGSWVIGGRACGVCFREDRRSIVNDDSCFVPHYVDDSMKHTEDLYTRVVQPPWNIRSRFYVDHNYEPEAETERQEWKHTYESLMEEVNTGPAFSLFLGSLEPQHHHRRGSGGSSQTSSSQKRRSSDKSSRNQAGTLAKLARVPS